MTGNVMGDVPRPGDRVIAPREDGRYDLGEVVTVTEGSSDAPRDYGGIVMLAFGAHTVVVQLDPSLQPFGTIEQAYETARRSHAQSPGIWFRRNMRLEPFT